MLVEAIDYLQLTYPAGASTETANDAVKRDLGGSQLANGNSVRSKSKSLDWEILVVSDGSTDKTAETALECARTTAKDNAPAIRVIRLEKNRGKGGAVTHGMRHVRGKYAVFADADGASKFSDLGKLVRECKMAADSEGRSVVVGSRAHLVGSEAVVKVRVDPILRGAIADHSEIIPTKLSHALISLSASPSYASSYSSYKRYTMRFQTIFATFFTIYNSLHAFRRVDI